MALNLNLLRSFHAVAEAGSVSRAAKLGYISQPALSKAVRELEKSVGIPLVERSARGVHLTQAGKTLYEHAKMLFALEQEAEEAIRSHRNMDVGTLRIGASTTLITYVLPPLLAQFRTLHPHLRFKTLRGNTRDVEALLGAYELDVALVEGPSHHHRVQAWPWSEDELVCVCAPDHPLAQLDSVWPGQLGDYDWVMREEGSGTREVIENIFRPYNLPPTEALEVGGAEALKQAVAAGLGIGIVSRMAAADQIALRKLVVVPLAEMELRRSFYLLRLKGRPMSPAAAAFENFLKEHRGKSTLQGNKQNLVKQKIKNNN
jgi:DNA-binding transcriptional LysR family regulator